MTARIVHETVDETRVLATDVEFADSFLSKARGLMFRSSLPDDYALVMELGTGLFGGAPRRSVHMLFVRVPLDVVWLVDDEVTRVETLSPWRGLAAARAERIIEFPAGGAAGVAPGETVRVER